MLFGHVFDVLSILLQFPVPKDIHFRFRTCLLGISGLRYNCTLV
jgi:hypothetical protein